MPMDNALVALAVVFALTLGGWLVERAEVGGRAPLSPADLDYAPSCRLRCLHSLL